VQASDPNVIKAQEGLAVPAAGRPAVALVLGYDKRFGEGGYGRSDTIILVRADPVTDSLSMLSFPRDLMVDIYCPGQAPFNDKINAAYATCNVQGTVATLHNLTGVDINYLITVNFRGFRQVVNRMDGVWVDVDHRYFNRNDGTLENNFAAINLKPGYQRLRGQPALDFVRFRHTDSDFHRNARQQAFMKAMKEQVASSFSITDLPGLLNTITSNVEVGRGGGSGISPREVLRYALFAYGLPPGHVFQSKIDGIEGYAQLYTDQSNIDSAVAEFLHPDVSSPEKAEEKVLGRRPGTPKTVRPAAVSVSVLNGNSVQGSAAEARALLRERGFHTVEPINPATANAPNQNYWHTTIYYDPAKKKAKAGARLLANSFGDAAPVKGIPPTLKPLQFNAMTVAVVGKTFHNRLAPAPVDKTPPKAPPVVRKDTAETLGMLRKAQRRMPFRLQVPTVLERYSDPDSSMPIRVYSMGGHPSVRQVFRLSSGIDYWGIQQTNWEDAPILDKPNTTRFLKGPHGRRRYDFYFNGPHMHMIVLRENDASYWVINTLSDALSNETMLAIARGLRPVPQKKK
jgi:LCP family protein required for cell wall assembly